MFLPILMLHRYRDRDEAMRLANDTDMGLTAGFYGGADEVPLVPGPHRGRRHLRQSPAGRDHRRVAGLPAVRRLEGLGLDRQGDRLLLLPAAIPARAVAHRGGVSRAMPFLSLHDAIAAHVADGASVALEGFTHLIPFAAGHELIRQRRRDLHLVRMTPDLIYDQLIGMGCARKLTFSWGGNPGVGSLHRLRDAVEHHWPRPLRTRRTQPRRHGRRLLRGAARLPFGMLRGYIGTDLARVNPRIRRVDCPFTGERLAAVPALNPDVTILHAQRADRAGNVAIHGIVGAQREAALAATRLIVTVEEIVDALPPAMNAIVLPHWIVTAVVHCPGGAYPSYAHGFYARDNAFYQRWDAIARDRETLRSLDGAPRARHAPTTRASSPASEAGRMTAATRDEMMTVAAARMLWDGCVCFVGIGLPSAACNLARLTHAPDIVLIYESGTIGTRPDVLPLSIGDGELAETAACVVPLPEVFAITCRPDASTSASSAPRRSTASATSTAP